MKYLINLRNFISLYIYNFIISIDQFGNVLCGGHHDITVSARVGYFISHGELKGIRKALFIFYSKIIDVAWYPKDNWGHCHYAFHSDIGDKHIKPSLIGAILLFPLILVICLIAASLQYVGWALGFVKHPSIEKRNTHVINNSLDKLHRINQSIDLALSNDKWKLLDKNKSDITKKMKDNKTLSSKIESALGKNIWV